MSFTTAELRKVFIEYFVKKGHTHLPSSSLIPVNDNTLLFNNAGMNQFKDIFLNPQIKEYDPIVTIQKCIRAGGKHNDLSMVGKTSRHHTFFEMLGNFSFGYYFKEQAIKLAYEFLVDIVKLPKEKLFFSVFNDDQETKALWQKLCNVDENQIFFSEENFWSMGDIGPCGPCTEIFYDQGLEAEERYLEIWNIVFMQYNKLPDGSIHELAYGCIDTGIGLERLASVSQQVTSNYQTDIIKSIKEEIKKQHPNLDNDDLVQNIVADHIRAAVFLISDGVLPGNEGRNYVLRRIIRRALNALIKYDKHPSFYKMAKIVTNLMGDFYPDIVTNLHMIESVLKQEEEALQKTLEQGLHIFQKIISTISSKQIPGHLVFVMYDTYGIPIDTITDLAEQHQMEIDKQGFDLCMSEQRSRGIQHSTFKKIIYAPYVTQFTGYDSLITETNIIDLYDINGTSVDILQEGQEGYIITHATSFFPGGGGQVSDIGIIKSDNCYFEVKEVNKINNTILHLGIIKQGRACRDQKVSTEVMNILRLQAASNHSATHLLHSALKKYFGDHVLQKGSLVTPQKLRFDFSYSQNKITEEDIQAIEDSVNLIIAENHPCITYELSAAEAYQKMPHSIDQEKHGDKIRIVTMGNQSISCELCCGTHVKRTGDIGIFKILSVQSVAAGVRRIEAITGTSVLKYIRNLTQIINSSKKILGIEDNSKIIEHINLLKTTSKQQQEILQDLTNRLFSLQEQHVIHEEYIKDIKFCYAVFEGVSVDTLRKKINHYNRDQRTIILWCSKNSHNNCDIIIAVSSDLQSQLPANTLSAFLREHCGIKGGGQASLAHMKTENQKVSQIVTTIKTYLASY